MKATFALLCTSLFAASAQAQTVFQGDGPNAHLGQTFDVIGDVTGDGIEDLVAGHANDDFTFTDAGRIVVLSGADGSIVRTHHGDAAFDHLGSQVSRTGDVDGDTIPDYMAAAIGYGDNKGAVHVFSGATGAQLHFLRGSNAGDRLGYSISAAGDMNGDNRGDLIFGAPGYGSGNSADFGDGAVYVVSGADGSSIHTLLATGLPPGNGYGMFTSSLGDVDADGVVDFMASAPDFNDPGVQGGHFRVLSGATGATIYQYAGASDGHGSANHIGVGLADAGDINGDGVTDFMVGMIVWWWPGGFHEGQEVKYYSGENGALISSHQVYYNELPATHPINPVNVGDVNGDGVPDMAYATPVSEEVRVVSGASGLMIDVLSIPEANSGFGMTVRGLADVNMDGMRDIAVGIPYADSSAGTDAGEIRIYSVDSCTPPTSYCWSNYNSAGTVAQIWHSGSTSAAANDFTLTAYDCPPGKPGLFFYGPNRINIPYADGRLCVGADSNGYFRVQPVVVTDAGGTVSQFVDNTSGIHGSGPGQIAAGVTWDFQFWFRDPQGGPNGFNFSNGLEVTFCP